MSVKLAFFIFSLSTGILWTANAQAPVSWSGKVVDIRTGAPVGGAKVYGGASGRVDLTEAAYTDANGRFTVTYQNGALDLGFWKFYMLTVEYSPSPGSYFTHVSAHPGPEEVEVRLIPVHGFFQGTIRDRESMTPIQNARVSLGQPGRYIETITTDSEGAFAFTTIAYEVGNWTNYEIGIAPENQVPHDTWNQPSPLSNYWIETTAEGYQRAHTAEQGATLQLRSSITGDIHTKVDFNLSPMNSSEPSVATQEMIDPSLYLRCSSQYFSTEQVTDPKVSGQNADPDEDGLSNLEECQIGTHPLQPDSDEDGMPDGWEITNGTSPLEADAHLDLDGDSFSNRLEFLYQSKAANAESIPEIGLNIKRAVRVDVSTIEGVTYQIQSSLTPDGPWSDRGAAFDGDGSTRSFYFDAESDSEVFKATVRDASF